MPVAIAVEPEMQVVGIIVGRMCKPGGGHT